MSGPVFIPNVSSGHRGRGLGVEHHHNKQGNLLSGRSKCQGYGRVLYIFSGIANHPPSNNSKNVEVIAIFKRKDLKGLLEHRLAMTAHRAEFSCGAGTHGENATIQQELGSEEHGQYPKSLFPQGEQLPKSQEKLATTSNLIDIWRGMQFSECNF